MCKHHDQRTDASGNKLSIEIIELGKPCKSMKEVKECIVDLESKRNKVTEMAMGAKDELQTTRLKIILMQMSVTPNAKAVMIG